MLVLCYNQRRPRNRARTTASEYRDPRGEGSLCRYIGLKYQGSRRFPDENRRIHSESVRIRSARPCVPSNT
jgi:hypothetical protein